MSISKRYAVMAVTTIINIAIFLWVDDYEVAANIFLAILAVKSWAFVAIYGLGSNWQSTAAGRAVMRLIACIALISTHGTFTVLWGGDYPGRPVIRPLLLAGVALAVMDLLLTLISIQRDERKEVL